jgi:hypothetical protein
MSNFYQHCCALGDEDCYLEDRHLEEGRNNELKQEEENK